MHPYLQRRQEKENFPTCPHPSLEPVLERTLGVPLFQEQLLRMAGSLADFTGGEAEELRRAMRFKRPEGRCRKSKQVARGHDEERDNRGDTGKDCAFDHFVCAIGFPESHAVSFALLAYASA